MVDSRLCGTGNRTLRRGINSNNLNYKIIFFLLLPGFEMAFSTLWNEYNYLREFVDNENGAQPVITLNDFDYYV